MRNKMRHSARVLMPPICGKFANCDWLTIARLCECVFAVTIARNGDAVGPVARLLRLNS